MIQPLFILLAFTTIVESGSHAMAAGTVTQLTAPEPACSYLSPQLSEDGRWLVAVSLCPTGANQDHQIVRIERASGQAQTLTPPGSQSVSPSLSGDGRRIALASNADLVPGQNGSHLDQVFLFDAVTHRYTQLTRIGLTDTHRTVQTPRISGDGGTVVFASNANLVSNQNEDGNLELFVFDVGSGQLLQVTQTEAPARHQWPLVSHDGQTVVFLGIHPPFGKRPLTGVYHWSRKTGKIQLLLETPYPDAGAFTQLVMAGKGTRLVFSGRYDLVGENPDRNTELFMFDIATGIARQVTHTVGCTSAHPALSADGLRVVFVSNCRFDKLNPDRDTNLFLMRLDSGDLVQVTDTGTSAVVEPLTMDQAGRLLAVSIGAELKGMVNPGRLLQIAAMDLPFAEAVGEVPLRLVTADKVSDFLVSRHEPDTLYLSGRGLGIMKSQDGGRFWRLASFGLGTETVTCLLELRERGLLVAGTFDVGVYKTMDGGIVWVPANTGLADRRVLALAADPGGPDVIYAETPTGLFRSRDLGEHWELFSSRVALRSEHQETAPISLPHEWPSLTASRRLIPEPGSSGRLLWLSETGLFRLSGDDGKWSQVKTPYPPQWVVAGPEGVSWFLGTSQGVYRANRLEEDDWVAMVGLPSDLIPPIAFGPQGTGYAAVHGGIYRSLDRGLTWTRFTELQGVAKVIPEASASGVLVAALDNGNLLVSRDGGLQWSPLIIPAPSPQGFQSVLIRPSP